MMTVALVALMIVLYTAQSFVCKLYSDRYPGDARTASPVFSVVYGAVVAVVTFAVSGCAIMASPTTLLLAAVNALMLALYNLFLVRGSQKGPYSVLMAFILIGGIMVPTVVAALFFDEPVSPLRALALAGILASICMISAKGHPEGAEKKQKVTLPFLLLAIGLFLANGMYGTLLDVQQRMTGAVEKDAMIVVSYLLAALFSLIGLAVTEKKAVFRAFRQTKLSLVFLLIASAVDATAVNILTYIIPLINVTVLYSFNNAGVMLLSVLASAAFFKEKYRPVNIAGCALMCASLIAVSLFE